MGMHIRGATVDDAGAVRRVAERSLRASYDDLLDAADVERAVEEWYARERLADQAAADDAALVLAEAGDEVVGFAQCELLTHAAWTDGRVLWLHVAPAHRDEGVAADLIAETEERLEAAGADRVSASVLAGHEAGNAFYRHHGYERVDEWTVTVGERSMREHVFVRGTDDRGDVPLSAVETPDGDTVFVDEDEADRGSVGPFYRAYTARDAEQPWGWVCGSCGSADTAMDTMGRVECNDCENTRKATRWDAAYL